MFASYGSAGAGVIGYGTPINFSDEQRVGLRPSLGVGILLTREEFDELVPHFFNNHRFDVSVLNYVFEMTAGHIGACLDFLLLIQRENSYRSMRPPQQYTRDMFILNVDPNEFFRSLLNSTIFSRGFPSKVDLGDPSYANGLRLVLNESHRCKITNPREPLHPDINVCHQKGWLYSETVDNNIIYRFASPLHERQAEWLLLAPAGGTIGQATLREFAIAVIKGFNPLNLQERNDLGVMQRIPKAQYQQEFYRATFALTHACVMMFSEFGNGFGRVDFYIRSKKWAIEFLRDRDRLPEHQERFLSGEYVNWISTNAIDDYIIIDCRSISNQQPKPAYKNLIRVIFTDDYMSVEIQDNNNKLLDQFNLTFGSGL
ncbi:hypothetical protein FRC18_006138 [Serendipita sp. 400]|nr:hypothetical protein FRC18_006138 [Serendipita sp. 400]